jgi:hypothetical protein
MSAKPKTSAKREAVAKVFGKHPVDSTHLNFLHARRHLATVKDGRWRELAYVIELDELEQHVWTTLDRIRERDGAKIFKEVAERLVDSVAASIEDNEKQRGRRRVRRANNNNRSAAH